MRPFLGLALSCCLALLGLPVPASAAHAVDPAHDFRCGRGRAKEVRVTACERSTRHRGMEPMVERNSRGTLFMTVVTDAAVTTDPAFLTGSQQTFMLRSRNDGRTWKKIALPKGISASEAIIHVDRATNRLFVTSMSLDLTHCGYPVSWSDDEGATWHGATKRPGCIPLTVGDWPKVFTGPLPHGVRSAGYPRAIYTCNFTPDVLVAAALVCWHSFDGGRTFSGGTMLPALNGLCLASGGGTTVHGNGPETIVHSTGQVLRDGTVVIPVMVCGRIVVMRSGDGGAHWKVFDTGSDAVGWFNWLANLSTQAGADNVYNMMVFDQALAQDARGNLFLGYPATGGVRLAYSRDGGRTWHQRGKISTRAVAMPWLVSVAARGRGQVAVAYLGTNDVGEKVLGGGERYRNWMGYSPNAFRRPFAMAPTSPMSRPAITAGGLLGSLNGNSMGSSIGPGANTHMFVEYTGVRFAGRNRVRAAFARFTDSQGSGQNPLLVLGKLRIDR